MNLEKLKGDLIFSQCNKIPVYNKNKNNIKNMYTNVFNSN